jgi:hypothetical protein
MGHAYCSQAPEIQALRFTNVVWLHYRAPLMRKILSVSVNIINNIMRIHCLRVIGSVLSNDFPLILILIGNVLGFRGLKLPWIRLTGEGMELEPSPLNGYRRAAGYPMAVT